MSLPINFILRKEKEEREGENSVWTNLRFKTTLFWQVRLLAASLSTTALVLYIAIVTYLPALALEQVWGSSIPSPTNTTTSSTTTTSTR